MRVLFLGNNYNPISVAALEALLASRAFDVAVGVYDPQGESAVRTARRLYRDRGAAAVARRVGLVVAAQARVRLRRSGVPLRGYTSLQELLVRYQPDHFWCRRINSPESRRVLRRFEPAVIAVANFSQILKPSVLAIPPRGCVNLHPSLLPKYRGPSPFYWALQNRERQTGVTVHYVDEGIDSGDIIGQVAFEIGARDREVTLRARAAAVGARLLVDALEQIAAGTAPRTPQTGEPSYYSFPPRGRSAL
jgi:methionyl-tRNA formyltransferase